MPDESTSMGEPSFPIQKPNAAEGEFMSNAAIGCLSFGARSEHHRRPTAAEHSFGSSLFKRVREHSRTLTSFNAFVKLTKAVTFPFVICEILSLMTN